MTAPPAASTATPAASSLRLTGTRQADGHAGRGARRRGGQPGQGRAADALHGGRAADPAGGYHQRDGHERSGRSCCPGRGRPPPGGPARARPAPRRPRSPAASCRPRAAAATLSRPMANITRDRFAITADARQARSEQGERPASAAAPDPAAWPGRERRARRSAASTAVPSHGQQQDRSRRPGAGPVEHRPVPGGQDRERADHDRDGQHRGHGAEHLPGVVEDDDRAGGPRARWPARWPPRRTGRWRSARSRRRWPGRPPGGPLRAGTAAPAGAAGAAARPAPGRPSTRAATPSVVPADRTSSAAAAAGPAGARRQGHERQVGGDDHQAGDAPGPGPGR